MAADPAPTVAEGAPASANAPAPTTRGRRSLAFLALAFLAMAAVGGWLYWRRVGVVSTDDAFVRATVVQVTAEVDGRVLSVAVEENGRVEAGDELVRLDDTELALALAQAEAGLEQARSGEEQTADAVAAAEARVAVARSRVADAERDLALQERLYAGRASTAEARDRAASALVLAKEQLQAAVREVEVARSTGLATPGRIHAAEAAVAQARRRLEDTVIRASASGTAARVEVAPGEVVHRGTPLLAIVTSDVWVTANFKETDIAELCPGAPAELRLDAWPDEAIRGAVDSTGPATGATFSLLSADNATGNFVKVVQRLPVRIRLDRTVLRDRPIPVGLSATVRVDTTACAHE